MRYEHAVETLFQAPLDQFVTERKRLAAELKAEGDKTGAARLARLTRPPISAWVVDQLWWRARPAFEALFDTAERVRRGDFGATAAHREAIAGLRARAVQILGDAQHVANEVTLRRVTQTLSALAAAGGWDPDAPGALTADRDPPGFEAIGINNVIPFPVQPRRAPEPASAASDTETTAVHHRSDADEIKRRLDREAAAARAQAAAELRRAEAERARAAAERQRLEAALRTAQGDVLQREREVIRLERDLATARNLVAQARAVVADLEDRLAQLDN